MTEPVRLSPCGDMGGAAAEQLVIEGLRRWLDGYRTGSIDCWERAWNLYACALGVERARATMTGLSCYARALNAWTKGGVHTLPYDCPRRCPQECLAVALVAASQAGDQMAAGELADELVLAPGLPAALETAAGFADALRGAKLFLPRRDALPCLWAGLAGACGPGATRH